VTRTLSAPQAPIHRLSAAATLIAVLSVGALLAAPAGARRGPQAPSTALAADAAAIQSELAGIPQRGLTLGFSTAPVTVVEYADLFCGPCANAATNLLAPLIADYVRQGTVRLELDPITLGQRSSEYAYGAYAASLQGAGWDYALLTYARSTAAGSGPPNAPDALALALGLDVHSWRSSLFRPRWARYVEHAVAVASVGNFTSFPVFTVRGVPDSTGEVPVTVLRPLVTLDALNAAITAAQSPAQGTTGAS